MKSDLNLKQQTFCEEYIIDLNGTQAAIRAGYSENSAKEIASTLLTNINISEYIRELKEKRSERTEITADMVIQELAKVGFANLQDYLEIGNTFKDVFGMDKKKTAALESIKVTETEWEGGTKTTTQFRLHDKISALDKLGRHLGIFEKDNSQSRIVLAPDLTSEQKQKFKDDFDSNH